ncbi:hypothetical protein [Azospirillum soli]|uniref:hypothetical protein n=1 Tax=Azospirillum soli TaxID=1304799 RepID=UPI001AE6FA0F|nr:hypothetical protein [Azospirillum soli]MBP2313352.1 hypothetical protein [Azospirillum soli]
MAVLRLLGAVFLLAALGALAWDATHAPASGFRLSALGELWFRLSPYTLDLSRAVTERYIWPELWDPGIVAVLLQPAVLVLGGLGLLLVVLGMLGRRRR